MKMLNKKISIDNYINQALYNKKNGYYMKKLPIGKKGDFITSPKISNLFSEMIGVWSFVFKKYLSQTDNLNVIELGAGDGDMMYQIIKVFQKLNKNKTLVNFYIIERSAFLKKIQKKKLNKFKVKWIKNLKDIKKGNCLFLGNEFLDSLAIKQFIKKGGQWYEKYILEARNFRKIVYVKKNIKLYERELGINLSNKQNFIELPIEKINLINEISEYLKKNNGGMLFIDYGYKNGKMSDSIQALKCHKKVNYLRHKGKADITHLINFNLLKRVLKKNDLRVNGPVSQAFFLKKIGIFERAEMISKNLNFLAKSDVYYRLKRLTHQNEMGELFKVIFATNKKINFKFGFKK